jgi:hypothetical protein
MMLRMIAGIAETTREVRPELWRRYLDLLMDGLRADRADVTPFTVPPLEPDEVDRVKDIGRPPRR